MLLIDTHAHLYYDNMYENLSEVLNLAELNNVKKTICIGTDLETCLLYTSPSPRDRTRSRMPSSA